MPIRPILRHLVALLAVVVALPGAEAAALRLTPLTLASGPWMQLDARGMTTVSVRLVPPVDPAALRALRLRLGKALAAIDVDARVVPTAGGAASGQVVASWRLPPMTSGEVRLGADPDAPLVRVPVPPTPADPVRIAIVGGRGWPTGEEIAATGSPPTAVLVLGTASPLRLGSGGWEPSIPIILRLGPGKADDVALAVLGAGDPDGADLSLGCLGLPSARRGPDAAVDCATRPRPWNVLLDPEALWDIGFQATTEQLDARRLRTPLGVARLLGVPLILAGGSRAGFVSEPLGTGQDGALAAEAGGVRYVAATPVGEGVRSLSPLVATSIDEPGLALLDATPDRLSLRLGAAVDLEWTHDPDVPSTGTGRLEVVPAVEAWRTSKEIAPGLPWVPRAALAAGEWNVLDLFALAVPAGGVEPTPAARALARRLVADPWFLGDEPALLRRLPVWLRREALLRWMGVPPDGDHNWIGVAAATDDQELVLALLASVERGNEAFRDALVRRLSAQASGRIPVDADPILQSRLASAVFDAPTLSPTPLRPIARDLVSRLSPLGAAPVQRFLDRVGRFRPSE